MALILNEPGLTAAVHPPSFNKFRMSGGVDGRTPASPPPAGQSAAYPAAGSPTAAHPAAYYSAHPELVEGWQPAGGWTAAAAGPQLIPAEPAVGGEGAV